MRITESKLRRVIRRKLENPLATQLLEERFKDAKAVWVKASDNGSDNLVFSIEN